MTASKQDLKTIIKPLIKECVKEVILESGVLSKIITEVVQGLQGSMIIEARTTQPVETKTVVKDPEKEKKEQQAREELIRERNDRASKMIKATGMEKMFSNLQTPLEEPVRQPVREVITAPIIEEKEIEVQLTEEERIELLEEKRRRKESDRADEKFGMSGGTALRGVDPSDPGLNVNALMSQLGVKNNVWKKQFK